ncbi:TetR/AcrR family transcriptional regulator [Rhodococcus sp. ABRD24]|nr:TetR/AcrR family transcriptional regulator [Rhodococcus sp. ABRD24]
MGAAQAFDRFGYFGSSVGEIVDGARITKGALYFHFASKDDLAQFIIGEQHRISLEAVEAIAASDARGLEQVVMLCHELARQTLVHPVVRAGARLTVELGAVEALNGAPGDPYLEWTEGCARLAARAVEQGDLVETVSPLVLARHLICAIAGARVISRALSRTEDLERRVDEMWELLLPSIVPVDRHGQIGRIRAARWSTASNCNGD